ncbi:MAG: pyridoxal-dependent decarboxylase, partial [Bacteroidota bacterium]
MLPLDFTPTARKEVWDFLLPRLESYYANTQQVHVSPPMKVREIQSYSRALPFDQPHSVEEVIEHVIHGLTTYSVHTPHPSYFGLYNPRSQFSGIIADLITATFNPQLAAWSHAPFANEIERYVIEEFGQKFGYPEASIDGTFCSGGAESNLTALLCALNQAFPEYDKHGIVGTEKEPVIYCSSESHHSLAKAARMAGLGAQSVREIAVDANLRMNLEKLKEGVGQDRKEGRLPLMLVGTAGTTGAGAVDNLMDLPEIAQVEGLWYHVDAAYGGAAILSESHPSLFTGIEKSDSLTLDLHKWFSVPMGASLFITPHKRILNQTFGIKTAYMPEDGDPNQVADPYTHSAQWSRRFMGLKMYFPLAIHGWQGLQEMIEHQLEMGDSLRNMLTSKGWTIANRSPLPVVCVSHPDFPPELPLQEFVDQVNATGKAWISVYPIHGKPTIRVC